MQMHRLACLGRWRFDGRRQVDLQQRVVGLDLDARERAEVLNLGHDATGARVCMGTQANAFRPQHRRRMAGQAACGVAIEHIGSADKLRHETSGRRVVDLGRRPHLFKASLVEDAASEAVAKAIVDVM